MDVLTLLALINGELIFTLELFAQILFFELIWVEDAVRPDRIRKSALFALEGFSCLYNCIYKFLLFVEELIKWHVEFRS